MEEIAIDLSERWRRARCAALREVCSADETNEDTLLRAALARDPEAVLRRVFDNSLKLGQGFRRYYRLDLPLAELVAFLPRLGVPCLERTAARADAEPAFRLERPPCPAATAGPALACDYWREAVQGLVHGMTGAVRHARHESGGRAGTTCVDVLYVAPQSPLRFGPIPEPVREGLESLRRSARAFDSTVALTFLGINEGVLHYTATHAAGPGQVRVSALVEQGVRRRFPWLTAREVTPQPVFAEASP